ncbi:hypothetical protein AVEN_31615-1 [Araneus ventricosus]|uniref:Acyltransferase 3 domain-containing protein n=1 Tax=Araneus ventricosus TaxID=182803 RepID=A0A4Y2JCU3_ARAVE|nr:hypothetical protein AVEN_31615-1 [Araneus ventricosus]
MLTKTGDTSSNPPYTIGSTAEWLRYVTRLRLSVSEQERSATVSSTTEGGFLNAVSFCKDYKKNGKTPLLSFYIHRFLRYSPTYMIVLGFYAILMSYTGSGRLWPNYDTNPVCKRTWGWNLLHLNNFQNQYEQCYKPTWFYAGGMQLHIVSPLILIPLIKWPIVGYACVCVCILASSLLLFVLTVKFNLMHGFSAIAFNFSDLKTFYGRYNMYMDIIWDKPYTRLSSFLVGIAYGCYFHRKNFTKAGKSSKLSLYYGLIAFAISTWISSIRNNVGKSTWETAVHDIISSFLFCICSAWILYACSSGQGGSHPLNFRATTAIVMKVVSGYSKTSMRCAMKPLTVPPRGKLRS